LPPANGFAVIATLGFDLFVDGLRPASLHPFPETKSVSEIGWTKPFFAWFHLHTLKLTFFPLNFPKNALVNPALC